MEQMSMFSKLILIACHGCILEIKPQRDQQKLTALVLMIFLLKMTIDNETRLLGHVITEKVIIDDENGLLVAEESEKTIINGHFGLLNLRIKKQRIACNAQLDEMNISNNQERPMSWEGELSNDDLLTIHDGEKTLSSKRESDCKSPSSMTMELGSPASLNETKTDEPTLNQQKPIAEKIIIKPISPYLSRACPDQNPEQLCQLSITNLNHSMILGVPEPNSASHYFTPQVSPLQPRHKNSHSFSSSSSPELTKNFFYSPTNSPIQSRHLTNVGSTHSQRLSPRNVNSQETVSSPTNLSFSPTHSPVQSRHITSQDSSYSSPYSSVGSPSGSSSIHFSPNQSPIQSRHLCLKPGVSDSTCHSRIGHLATRTLDLALENKVPSKDMNDDQSFNGDICQQSSLSGQATISRQQLINSPCPVCGDKISGFHYGIFSCESCKGFFKRTVQNKKNYLCLRGASCLISVNTRKKCPACRFDKCLKTGMKLEAIREDRTRGGRSTYQCSYTLPSPMIQSPGDGNLHEVGASLINIAEDLSTHLNHGTNMSLKTLQSGVHKSAIPELIENIMSVEHLWHYSEGEVEKIVEHKDHIPTERRPDFFSNLCNIADHRLYKIVKWCKSLPLFRNIQIDDQICLLLNSWCELLLLSCCFRSIPTPDEIRVSLGKSLNLGQARSIGLDHVIERMLNLTDHLRRLQIDQCEYVCLKVIILLTSDVTGLKEPESVRQSQEKVIQALQTYSLSHYPQHQSKFGELLLRIPELKRTCLIGKESLSIKHREGDIPGFNLLIELLRGEH